MCLLTLLVEASGQVLVLPMGGERVVTLLLVCVNSFLMLLLHTAVWIMRTYDPDIPTQMSLHSIAVQPDPLILYIFLLIR